MEWAQELVRQIYRVHQTDPAGCFDLQRQCCLRVVKVEEHVDPLYPQTAVRHASPGTFGQSSKT